MAFFWGGGDESCSQEGLTAVNVSNQETDFCGAEKVLTALEQRSIENTLPIFRPRAHKCALLNPSVSGVRRGGMCAGQGRKAFLINGDIQGFVSCFRRTVKT